jgi:hypothetical protein
MTSNTGGGQFFVVFNSINDLTQAQKSTIFEAMTLLGVRILDESIPGNFLVEGREQVVASMVAGSKDWTYTPVARLGPKTP